MRKLIFLLLILALTIQAKEYKTVLPTKDGTGMTTNCIIIPLEGSLDSNRLPKALKGIDAPDFKDLVSNDKRLRKHNTITNRK
jgi:hypothetical protein